MVKIGNLERLVWKRTPQHFEVDGEKINRIIPMALPIAINQEDLENTSKPNQQDIHQLVSQLVEIHNFGFGFKANYYAIGEPHIQYGIPLQICGGPIACLELGKPKEQTYTRDTLFGGILDDVSIDTETEPKEKKLELAMPLPESNDAANTLYPPFIDELLAKSIYKLSEINGADLAVNITGGMASGVLDLSPKGYPFFVDFKYYLSGKRPKILSKRELIMAIKQEATKQGIIQFNTFTATYSSAFALVQLSELKRAEYQHKK